MIGGAAITAINNMRSQPEGPGTVIVAAIATIIVLVLVALLARDWLKERAARVRRIRPR